MVSNQPEANRIIVNAAEHDDLIESVVIFQSNRAEIKRRINIDLKRGQNRIRIERLPSRVNEDSIRVDGTGTAVIFDVAYHAPSLTQDRAATATIDLRRTLEALQKERNIARQQSEFLENYGKTLDSKSIGIEDVHRFLDTFGPRQLAVAKRVQELDVRIDKAQEELSEAQHKDFEGARGALRGTAITVTVLAETDGSAELKLTYVVPDASWTPLYDVRASIAPTPEATSKITLHYRASITQTTGENWPNVALSLSTASPLLGSSVPKLSPWRIGIPVPAARPPWRTISPSSPMHCPTSPMFSPASPRYSPSATPHLMVVRKAQIADVGVLNTTYGIPGHSDIPSNEGSHKVVITVLELQAELEWVCVPREKECVFLSCKVVNSSEFALLPGEASIFVDDNFVSKSRIEHVSPNESFKASLGVDSALRVTYPTPKTLKRTAAQAGFSFMAKEKQSISTQSQRVMIRNSRKAPVSVSVLDHIPVSTDTRLKVNIIAPNGLDTATASSSSSGEGTDEDKVKERPWKRLRKGLQARWAPLEASGEGTIEWSCDIPPSDEVETELAWEVLAPEGQEWENI